MYKNLGTTGNGGRPGRNRAWRSSSESSGPTTAGIANATSVNPPPIEFDARNMALKAP